MHGGKRSTQGRTCCCQGVLHLYMGCRHYIAKRALTKHLRLRLPAAREYLVLT